MNPASPTRILFMISLLHGATHLYTIFLQPLNSDLKAYFGLTLDQQVTRIPALSLGCYAAANFAAGLLAPHVAPRLLLSIGPIINGICVIGMYFLRPQDYTGMLVLTALSSLGGGLYHPIANLVITETFPTKRGRALGLVGIGASFTFIIGPMLASQAVHRGWCDWRTICLIYGITGVCCGLLAWFVLPAGKLQRHAPLSSTESGRVASQAETRAVLSFAVLMILAMAGREIGSWGTTAVTQQFTVATHANPPDPGFLLGLMFVPGLIVQPLAGRWSDRVGRELVMSIAYFMMATTLFVMPFVPAWALPLCYVSLGTFMTATVPTTEALLADRAPPRLRGLIFGLVITAAIGIGATGPSVAGWVADAGGRTPEAYRNALWTLGALTLCSFVMALILKPAAKRLNVTRFAQHTPAPAAGE